MVNKEIIIETAYVLNRDAGTDVDVDLDKAVIAFERTTNIDNTADLDKPVSIPQSTAIANSIRDFTLNKIDLVNEVRGILSDLNIDSDVARLTDIENIITEITIINGGNA